MAWLTVQPSAGASALRQVIFDAIAPYPELYYVDDPVGHLVRGSFPVGDAGGVLDRFLIEITIPADYPRTFPIVREIGGRIPWLPDRHCNFNGTACLVVPEEWQALSKDRSFKGFLTGPLRNYFVGQALVDRGLPWPSEERPHGEAGAIEGFANVLGFLEKDHQIAALRLLTKSAVPGHHPCPCGSGLTIRRCHLAEVRSSQEIVPPWLAEKMLIRLGAARSRPASAKTS